MTGLGTDDVTLVVVNRPFSFSLQKGHQQPKDKPNKQSRHALRRRPIASPRYHLLHKPSKWCESNQQGRPKEEARARHNGNERIGGNHEFIILELGTVADTVRACLLETPRAADHGAVDIGHDEERASFVGVEREAVEEFGPGNCGTDGYICI